jgi:hypothetical protein
MVVSGQLAVVLRGIRNGDLRPGHRRGPETRAEDALCLVDAGTKGNRKMKKVRAFEVDPAPLDDFRGISKARGVPCPRAFEERPAPLA